ncbi:MAG: hypothetical protein ACOYIR_05490 [Christensenellales bacterium]|jgi:vacuolar-type H+-ATPase subunit H
MSTKILDLLAQLETAIDESPRPRISAGAKRIVDMDTLADIFSDLRVSIPDEIRWAQAVLAERDETIAAARKEAEEIVREAKEQREKLIDGASISAEAELRAKEMIYRAKNNAEIITKGARDYTDDILYDLQRYLREYIDIIEKNREELHRAYDPEESAPAPEDAEFPDETEAEGEEE